MVIEEVAPEMALPEGVVRLRVAGFEDPSTVKVTVGGEAASLVGATTECLTIRVPSAADGVIKAWSAADDGEVDEATARIRLGTIVSQELHPVANPAIDDAGNIYVTYSGARGEEVTFGVFVVSPEGEVEPFLADLVNPTGLVMGPDGCLYISSRHSGEVYRSTLDKRIEKYAGELGLATGLAFDSKGNLLVGDRSGTLYKVHPDRQIETFCTLEPSVSAYHLAVDADDNIFVTAPTLATQDAIQRVTPDGRSEVLYGGLGRPQGIGFSPEGLLQVVASYRGRKGLYTLTDEGPRLILSGPMLVGFAYSPDGQRLYCVDNSSLFMVSLFD